jgi:nitrite reductase/ring-hydroxylating ferredoxin subunit
VGGAEIGIFRIEGRLYAWSNYCPHAGGPVCQGVMIDRVVERLDEAKRSLGDDFMRDQPHLVCPWHGYEYDVRTGAHPGDARIRLRPYPISEDAGEIVVEL